MSKTTPALVVPDLLRLRAENHPDQIVMNVNGDRTLTYDAWHQRSSSVARGLLARGTGHGERIALLFGGLDWIDYAIAYLGIVTAGATAVHMHHEIEPAEMARRIAQCGVTGLVHSHEVPPPAGFTGWTATVDDLAADDDGRPVKADIRPDDLADILYTSGTTGAAKAISTPHGNLTFGRGPEGFRQLGDPKPLLAPIPLGTTSSATTMAIALTNPATLVLCPVGDVERMAELIAQYRIKSVMFTPWIGIQMVAAKIHERHDLSCVDTLATASAPLPPATASALLRMMPNAQLTSVYAAREAVPAVIAATFDVARPFCVGRPVKGSELLVADENGDPVTPGETGEIWLRCAAPKRLFLEGAEREGQLTDEWTRTRDLGHQDEDGELHLFDRISDAVTVDGKLVSTIHVEAALYECPGVEQVAVVGVPDGKTGQDLVAVLVLAGPDDLPAVQEFVTRRLEPHQRPVRFQLAESLPRGVMGKVLKHQLRKTLTRS
ncbi:acyl--CoA ligase [Streptomyces sp. NBC_01485]|uniref:class I adenylate-forming enzyme family protein n=1 Tax=Streptomyces sp. NBC_01485 TaxID=2903884 RepID=UPI002E345F39|nr:class I adenylate-forming enzyme family protein [Streptomyces sp. NBC_01485]